MGTTPWRLLIRPQESGLSSEFPTDGFFAKSMDGRIDDQKAAGKAKGYESTYATRTPWHLERRQGDNEQGCEVPVAA